jgi:hypothetical protein
MLTSDQDTLSSSSNILSASDSELVYMLREQMRYPPNIWVLIHGTHTETYKTRDNKTEKRNVTDFEVKLNMTHLLVCPNPQHQQQPELCFQKNGPDAPCRYVNILNGGEKGYRGGVFPSKKGINPISTDAENITTDPIKAWAEAYVGSKHKTRRFVMKRKVTHIDTNLLTSLITSLVQKTNYRGHLKVSFPSSYNRVEVYSPSLINKWRHNIYVCWFFYLTFLWIITWPILWLITKRYEPLEIIYPYRILNNPLPDYEFTSAQIPTAFPRPPITARMDPKKYTRAAHSPANEGPPLVQSEQRFFNDWEKSIKRAVLSQHQGWIDGIYRTETEALGPDAVMTLPSTGNVFLNGVGAGIVRVARGAQAMVGWGADS